MAFKRTQNPKFSTLVTVNIPNDKGGFDKNTFVAFFKRPTTTEIDELRSQQITNEALVRRQLIGWDMRDDETGEPVPFNELELEAVLSIAPTPLATAIAFWESVNGARSKN
jgi:hypothetical protein